MKETEQICCICKKRYEGFGNNPDPMCIEEGARCCDECNDRFVIPARILRLNAKLPMRINSIENQASGPEGKSLEAALEFGRQQGFTGCVEPYGPTYDIEEYLELLKEEEDDSPENYILIGSYVLNLDDAWKKDAEIYELI